MDKSRVCVTRVSTALKKACNKKTNLLVFDKNKDPSPSPPEPAKRVYIVTPCTTAKAKKIRICTSAELKKMCPPKLCKCPTRSSIGFLGWLSKMMGFGLKGAIAAGLVYWSFDIGLWGPNRDTVRIYQDMCHVVAPVICPESKLQDGDDAEDEECEEDEDSGPRPKKVKSEVCENQKENCFYLSSDSATVCCSKTPSIEKGSNILKEKWNEGITGIFDFLLHAPERVENFYGWFSDKLHGLTTTQIDPDCIPEDEKQPKKSKKRKNCPITPIQ